MANVPHTAQELETAQRRLNRARKVLQERTQAAEQDLELIAEELPSVALESAVTGDTSNIDTLLNRRRIAERDLEAAAAVFENQGGAMSRLDRQITLQLLALKEGPRNGLSYQPLPRYLVEPVKERDPAAALGSGDGNDESTDMAPLPADQHCRNAPVRAWGRSDRDQCFGP